MDFKMMMHILARVEVCGTENPPYLRVRSTDKQTNRPIASFSDRARKGTQSNLTEPIRFGECRRC